jgi:hypothetical protein
LNQGAPSVDYPVGRFFWGAWMALAFSLISGLMLALNFWHAWIEGWRSALLLGVWSLLVFDAAFRLKQITPKAWLCWNGHDWEVEDLLAQPSQIDLNAAPQNFISLIQNTPLPPPLQAGYSISVHLDFQKYVLVSLIKPHSIRRWFWVSKNSFPERWHGFRCAVYSPSG